MHRLKRERSKIKSIHIVELFLPGNTVCAMFLPVFRLFDCTDRYDACCVNLCSADIILRPLNSTRRACGEIQPVCTPFHLFEAVLREKLFWIPLNSSYLHRRRRSRPALTLIVPTPNALITGVRYGKVRELHPRDFQRARHYKSQRGGEDRKLLSTTR